MCIGDHFVVKATKNVDCLKTKKHQSLMLLQTKSCAYTAFTVQGKGQFQWVTSPMGLLKCPLSFQRLIEIVVHGLQSAIVYMDDLLVH